MNDDLEALARRAARDDLEAARRLVAILEERRGIQSKPPGVMLISRLLAKSLVTHIDPDDLEDWMLHRDTVGRQRASARITNTARESLQPVLDTAYAKHIAELLLYDDPNADVFTKEQLSERLQISCSSHVPATKIEREVRRLIRDQS